MDATTESIAHFIGLFQTTLEQARLRQELEKFTKEIPPADDLRAEAAPDLWLEAPHDLEDFDPGLTYRPTGPTSGVAFDPIVGGPSTPISSAPIDGAIQRLDVDIAAPPPAPRGEADPTVAGPQPGSLATFTYQAATLFDDDLLLNDLNAAFVDPGLLYDALAALAGEADALAGFDAPALPADAAWSDFAQAAVETVEQASAPQGDAAAAAIFRGDDAVGVHVDGRLVEEPPDLSDLLPARHRSEAMDEDSAERDRALNDEAARPGAAEVDGAPQTAANGTTGEAARDQDLGHDFSRDFSGDGENDENPADVDPGHEVVAGGNLAMNEIAIGSNWLDAGVFVVGGDVTRLDGISQTNVLIEHDVIEGGDGGVDAIAATASRTVNVAEIVTNSSAREEGDASASAASLSDSLPNSWRVTHVSGDVVTINSIEQYTFATDFDRAEIKFSASETYIGLGDNEIVNFANFNEIGYAYDLIFVAQDFIDISQIIQTNVLWDSDHVTTGGLGSAASGDNLLYNQASLRSSGLDQYEEISANFASAAEDLAAGAATIREEVARDALFEGLESLRVLHIDGSFTSINQLKQTNIVGDSDQIRLAMEGLQQRAGAEVSIVTGANALVNIAAIEETGVDSTIMAGGQVYDDALLYQADLIETDAPPTGVNLSSSLTSEAVAFLADGMIGADPNDDVDTVGADIGTFSELDVMQTMLA